MRFFFAGKNLPAAKRSGQRANDLLANIFMRGFAPRKHPAPGLQPGLHRKTAFCFSVNILYSGLTGQHPPSFLQSTTPYGCQHAHSRRHPASNLSPYISFYRPHDLSPHPAAYIPAWPASNLTPDVIFFTKQTSAFRQSIPFVFRQSTQAKQQTNPQKRPQKKQQKKGSRSFLRKNHCMNLSTAGM